MFRSNYRKLPEKTLIENGIKATLIFIYAFNSLMCYYFEFTMDKSRFNILRLGIIAILLLIYSIWLLYIRLNVDKSKLNYLLCIGTIYMLFSLYYLYNFNVMMFEMMGQRAVWVTMFSLTGYILILSFLILSISKRLKNRVFRSNVMVYAPISFSSLGASIGVILSAFMGKYASDDLSNFGLAFAILLLSYCFSISINYLYKYIYIKISK